jgi:hypothetical protein
MESQPSKKSNSSKSKGKPAQPGQGKSKSARRRRANRNLTLSAGVARTTTKFQSPMAPVMVATDTGLRRLQKTDRKGLSDAGIAFLKCAFAPPDFTGTSVGGVPDDFRGLSLVVKHRLVTPITFSATTDYYILLLPTPGYSYWVATTAAGVAPTAATTWTGVQYSDYGSFFGTGGGQTVANQVDSFRIISNHFEVIPTVNQMTWSGNIQSWKLPIEFVIRPPVTDITATNLFAITGLNGVLSTQANMYTGPFIMGLYTATYSSNPQFRFQDIIEGLAGTTIPSVVSASDFGSLTVPTAGAFPGLDNGFESMCIKITGITANETAILKTWSCVEYKVVPNSVLYNFASISPCDPLAIRLYREIILELPVGVPFDQNESFWKRVLGIINTLTGLGANLPGGYGLAARGLNLLGQAGYSFLD